MRSPLLAPLPQRVEEGSGTIELGESLEARIDPTFGALDAALARLRNALERRGVVLGEDGGHGVALEVRRDPAIRHAEGYRLEVDEERLLVAAAETPGAFYGLQTLAQWLDLQRGDVGRAAALSRLNVTDWPDLPHRGVLLDVSRSRVPTMETLFELVDQLSSWKINQLQLYTEHTFAYRGHQEVWAGSSPLTPDEIRRLDGYCTDRHIELVPNQNSFGHLHRWLRHPRYRPLAECPEGLEHPFSRAIEPFSLCPTDPRALELLSDLYQQLLPCFSSRQINVGLDETFDLGLGRSAERAAEIGTGGVYLDFLLEIHRLTRGHDRRMQFWGDILAKHPELVDRIPADVVVMSWGYEAEHPFETEIRPLRARGLEVYVCPGTSSWLSFAGRIDNAVDNIAGAVTAAADTGASGCLVTDWGDRGHLQPLPISFAGFLTAACFSWNATSARTADELPLAALLEAHALTEPSRRLASPLIAMGNLYQATGAGSFNGSALFHLVVSPEMALSHKRLEGLSIDDLERCKQRLTTVRAQLSSSPPSLIRRELDWVADALEVGVDIGLSRLQAAAVEAAMDLPADQRGRLASRLDELIAGHARLWPTRSRAGGATESADVLARARTMLEGSSPTGPGRG